MTDKRYINAAIAVVLASTAVAAPSRMRPVAVDQPDGTRLTVVAYGDEHFHYYATTDGVPLQLTAGEFHYYGSNLLAHDAAQRTDGERLTADAVDKTLAVAEMQAMHRKLKSSRSLSNPQKSSAFPTKGGHHFLVILAEFPDKRFVVPNAHEEFFNMLNQTGYSNYAATGSAADYYKTTSTGQFDPTFDVYGPVMMDHGYGYYGGGSDDSAAGAMIVEACRKIDADADFSIYDTDGDGEVDNVYVFYAGLGEADGGDPSTIWPHSWNLSDQGRDEVSLDGVTVDRYACSSELDGESKMNGIGTFCHEFAHVLGLPDLYNTSSMTTALTPGEWSLMDRGSYTNDGRTPPLMSGYERFELNWIEPVTVSHPKNGVLQPISANCVYRINTERENEYFILENRQQQGWDSYLPGHGMLVWHIDYNPNIWDRNVVNRDPSHQYVDIVEANGATSSTRASGFSFPGADHVTQLTNLRSWSGMAVDLPITDIEENDGVVRFKVAGGKEDVMPTVLETPADVTPTSLTLRWQSVAVAQRYLVDIIASDGTKAVDHLDVGNVTEFTATSLQPATVYVCSVTAADAYEESEPSNAVTATTLPPTFDMMRPVAQKPSDVTDDGFTASWQPLAGATGYRLTVSKRNRGGYEQTVCDFTGKTLPSGWVTTSTSFNSAAGFFGDAAPALRFEDNGESLSSATLPADLRTLSLWHRASRLSEGDRIEVEAECGGEWISLGDIPTSKDKGGVTTTFDESCGEIPDGCRRVRLTFEGSGIVAVDDVAVSYGGYADDTPIEGYADRDMAAELQARISGLEKGGRYVYSVRAYNGNALSLPSATIEVVTGNGDSSVRQLLDRNLVEVERGGIRVTDDCRLWVWSIDGRVVYHGKAASGELISLPRGVYVVAIGDGVREKVAVN